MPAGGADLDVSGSRRMLPMLAGCVGSPCRCQLALSGLAVQHMCSSVWGNACPNAGPENPSAAFANTLHHSYGNSMESSLVAVVVPKASVAEQWAQENNTTFNLKVRLCHLVMAWGGWEQEGWADSRQ